MGSAGTVAELVQRQWGDHRPGLRYQDTVLSHHQVASGAAARAALLADLLSAGGEPHLGVLLDNTPEFPLWLSAAALAGAAVAGINPTRRGAELARDILHTDCRVLVTERAHLPLLDGLDLPGVRMLVTDTDAYAELLAPYAGAEPGDTARKGVGPATRMLLYFTSGSTGAPKAAICTQGRLAAAGQSLVDHFGVRREDVHYICMPMFHGNAVIADWAPALAAWGRRRAAPPLLRLRIPRRRTGARGDVLHLCRPCRAVPAGHPRASGRPRAPAAARLRHRGRGGGRGPVPGAVRGATGRGLRLLRGRRGDPADPGHPGAGDREGVGPGRSRGGGPGDRRGTARRRLRRGGPADQRGGGDRGAGQPGAHTLRGLLAQRGGGGPAGARRLVLDRGPLLPGRRGFPLLRGPYRRPAAGRQREPGGRDDREHPGPLDGSGGRGGVRGAGPGHAATR